MKSKLHNQGIAWRGSYFHQNMQEDQEQSTYFESITNRHDDPILKGALFLSHHSCNNIVRSAHNSRVRRRKRYDCQSNRCIVLFNTKHWCNEYLLEKKCSVPGFPFKRCAVGNESFFVRCRLVFWEMHIGHFQRDTVRNAHKNCTLQNKMFNVTWKKLHVLVRECSPLANVLCAELTLHNRTLFLCHVVSIVNWSLHR